MSYFDSEILSIIVYNSRKHTFSHLLLDKYILAWLLKDTVKEFSKMAIEKILECIEGEIEIGEFEDYV